MDSSRSINVLSCRESQYCLDDHIFVAYLKEKFDPTFEFNLSFSNDRWKFELPRGELTKVRPLNRYNF
ncbi:hypothetical protein OOU_Y34scaffold00212g4 [Pyricularia oryzae Y34]|uniref:Uncharacterized protein n=2 Tax=Pyricularia oryzae TaxID=318829 RepID=A0AA97PPR8_PYRO3|nr:hypothetical protein OOU_Y34scaffold00212g4 [Pyricularia oryzae Y34]